MEGMLKRQNASVERRVQRVRIFFSIGSYGYRDTKMTKSIRFVKQTVLIIVKHTNITTLAWSLSHVPQNKNKECPLIMDILRAL